MNNLTVDNVSVTFTSRSSAAINQNSFTFTLHRLPFPFFEASVTTVTSNQDSIVSSSSFLPNSLLSRFLPSAALSTPSTTPKSHNSDVGTSGNGTASLPSGGSYSIRVGISHLFSFSDADQDGMYNDDPLYERYALIDLQWPQYTPSMCVGDPHLGNLTTCNVCDSERYLCIKIKFCDSIFGIISPDNSEVLVRPDELFISFTAQFPDSDVDNATSTTGQKHQQSTTDNLLLGMAMRLQSYDRYSLHGDLSLHSSKIFGSSPSSGDGDDKGSGKGNNPGQTSAVTPDSPMGPLTRRTNSPPPSPPPPPTPAPTPAPPPAPVPAPSLWSEIKTSSPVTWSWDQVALCEDDTLCPVYHTSLQKFPNDPVETTNIDPTRPQAEFSMDGPNSAGVFHRLSSSRLLLTFGDQGGRSVTLLSILGRNRDPITSWAGVLAEGAIGCGLLSTTAVIVIRIRRKPPRWLARKAKPLPAKSLNSTGGHNPSPAHFPVPASDVESGGGVILSSSSTASS